MDQKHGKAKRFSNNPQSLEMLLTAGSLISDFKLGAWYHLEGKKHSMRMLLLLQGYYPGAAKCPCGNRGAGLVHTPKDGVAVFISQVQSLHL